MVLFTFDAEKTIEPPTGVRKFLSVEQTTASILELPFDFAHS